MLGKLSISSSLKSVPILAYSAKDSIIRSMAITGRHSKNVAAKKNKLDAMKNKLFTRLGVKILLAAKAGGTDPNVNNELARALKEAQSIKLPKENIDRALKKATDTSADQYESGVYEVFGHGGVGVIVCTLTDNTNRVNKEIKSIARKADVKIASGGSVLYQFTKHAVFYPSAKYDQDALFEKAIEKDLDCEFIPYSKINPDDDEVKPDVIACEPENMSVLLELTEEANLPGSSNFIYLANEPVHVSDEIYQLNSQLIEELEKSDDIDSVYHNMDLTP